MKKAEGISITTYETGEGFMVDIVEMEEMFEAWIYHSDYGIKDMMFGWPKVQPNGLVTTYEDFLNMVACGWEEYADNYDEEHM